MPIQVTCPGCMQRFSVSEKFAGKEGPCPKCKAKITIPNPDEEVVIHAPEHSEGGAVGTGGRHALKTYKKKDVKFQPLVFAAVSAVVLVTLLVAFLLRGAETLAQTWPWPWPLIVGSIILGPPCAWAGYTFLRDAELEPYQGVNLMIRSLACGLVYALLWAIYVYLGEQIFADKTFSTRMELALHEMVILSVGVLGIGTFAAYVSFDLEPASAFFNCAMYFAVTVILRLVLGLPALPGLT